MNILDVLSGTEERNDNNNKCICGEELCKKCRRNIDNIKQEIEKQHTNTRGYGVNDFLFGKYQAYGNCLEIIDKHIGKEQE